MLFPVASIGLLNLNLRINSLAVIGLYFAKDIMAVISSDDDGIGHACHIGGLITGIFVSYLLKFPKDAIEERHRSALNSLIDKDSLNYSVYEDMGGLEGAKKHAEIALNIDDNNHETHLALARLKSKTDTYAVGSMHKKVGEGKDYYKRAIALMYEVRHPDTTNVFVEYFRQYGECLEADIHFDISMLLYKSGRYEFCLNSLEQLLLDKTIFVDIREKSLYYCGLCSEKIGLYDHAKILYGKLLSTFPDSVLRDTAKGRIKELDLIDPQDNENTNLSMLGLFAEFSETDKTKISSTFNWTAFAVPIIWSVLKGRYGFFFFIVVLRIISAVYFPIFISFVIFLLLSIYSGYSANGYALESEIWQSVDDYKRDERFVVFSVLFMLLSEPLIFIYLAWFFLLKWILRALYIKSSLLLWRGLFFIINRNILDYLKEFINSAKFSRIKFFS